MIQWQYAAVNDALQTEAGTKEDGRIRINAWRGVALKGPLVDLPAGRCTVRVLLDGPSAGKVRMAITADKGAETLASEYVDLGNGAGLALELTCEIPADKPACEVRLACWGRVRADIVAVEIALARALGDGPLDPARTVGYESRKSYADKIDSGFFAKYLSGPAILEVGYKGYEGGTVPIVPQAIGLDVGYPGYDGTRFPFADNSFDGIYSSHCFEHIGPWKEVLQDWHRVLKPGGFLVIVVPHQFLFERKRRLPSPINPDHKRFYTSSGLLAEIESAFVDNTYRVRHLTENDRGFDYNLLPYQGTEGAYEIELVVEKLERPFWNLDDGSVRPYSASEFFLRDYADRSDPWGVRLDLTNPTRCEVWGPYTGLGLGEYEVEFFFDLSDEDRALRPGMMVDVGEFGEQIAHLWIDGEIADRFFETGRVTLPFTCPKDQGIFEFRVWAPRHVGSSARPKFKGVVVRYRNRGTLG